MKGIQLAILGGILAFIAWYIFKSSPLGTTQNPNAINPLTGKPYGAGIGGVPVGNTTGGIISSLANGIASLLGASVKLANPPAGSRAVTSASGETNYVNAQGQVIATTDEAGNIYSVTPGTVQVDSTGNVIAINTSTAGGQALAEQEGQQLSTLQGNAELGSNGISTTEPIFSSTLSTPGYGYSGGNVGPSQLDLSQINSGLSAPVIDDSVLFNDQVNPQDLSAGVMF